MVYCTKRLIQYEISFNKPLFAIIRKKQDMNYYSLRLRYKGPPLLNRIKDIDYLSRNDVDNIINKLKKDYCYECGNTQNCRYFNPHL